MTDIDAPIHDLTGVHPGEQLEVRDRGSGHYVGIVDEVAPALGIVWVHELPGGYRRMVHTHDADLRRCTPGGGQGLPQ